MLFNALPPVEMSGNRVLNRGQIFKIEKRYIRQSTSLKTDRPFLCLFFASELRFKMQEKMRTHRVLAVISPSEGGWGVNTCMTAPLLTV